MTEKDQDYGPTIRTIMAWAAFILGFIFVAAFLAITIFAVLNGLWIDVAHEHVASIIGLPAAALASLLIVLVLRTVSGNIE